MNRRLTTALTGACAALIMLTGAHAATAKSPKKSPKKVEVSGKAYVFGHMDTPISNATIKVRELPKISVKTDAIGDFKLKVPNDVNVTPYIPSGSGLLTRRNLDDYSPKDEDKVRTHWNEIDLQTFHTRTVAIKNANFQVPADLEYAGLKAILRVESAPDGRPAKCAIVTTASVRSVRDVNYAKFESETARLHGHGVPGATSMGYPALGEPTYFTKETVPLPSQTETSLDGGIVWTEVPTGTYRIVTTSPTDRFASFLATCKPGRVVNANPPWGAYQLKKGEKPLGASNVAGNIVKAKAYKKHGKRLVALRVKLGEELALNGSYKSVSKPGVPALVGVLGKGSIPSGTHVLKTRMPGFGARRRIPLKLKVRMKDASGIGFTSRVRVTLPKLKKPKRNRR